MPVGTAAWLVAAGVLAGVAGTAGGITSLVSYPALLAAGVSPLPAGVANLVASVALWPGAALASRRELAGSRAVLAAALPVAGVAGAGGSALLLSTPPGVFADVVPWLVLLAAAAVLAQPALTARRRDGPRAAGLGPDRVLLFWTALASVYGGYFGAGSGIMLLAIVLIVHEHRLPRANAIKNMLVGASSVTSTVVFAAAGPVVWSATVPLGAGLLVGSGFGPAAARRLPAALVRRCAAALGVALAVELWLR